METLLVLPDAALADAAGTTVATGACTFAQSPVTGAVAAAAAAAAAPDAPGYVAVVCIGRMMLPLVPSCTTALPATPAAFILALGDAASGAVTSYTLTLGAGTSAAAVAEAVAILRHFTTMEAPSPGGVGGGSGGGGGTPPPPGHVLPPAAGGPSPASSSASSPGLAGRVERGSEVAARKILTLGETARHSIARRLAAATANAKASGADGTRSGGGGGGGGSGGRGRREAPVPKAVVWTFSGVGRASSGVAGALTGVGHRVATAVGGGLAESGAMRRAREAPPNSVGGVFHTALSTGCLAFANIYEVRLGGGGGGRRARL